MALIQRLNIFVVLVTLGLLVDQTVSTCVEDYTKSDKKCDAVKTFFECSLKTVDKKKITDEQIKSFTTPAEEYRKTVGAECKIDFAKIGQDYKNSASSVFGVTWLKGSLLAGLAMLTVWWKNDL